MQTQSKQIDFNGQNFYCGIDTHKKNWTVTIQTDELVLKTFLQDPEPDILIKHLRKNYPGGTYLVGYEAGYFGYSIQREFESKGVSCMVIHPADIPTTQKERADLRGQARIPRAIGNPATQNRAHIHRRAIQTTHRQRIGFRIAAPFI